MKTRILSVITLGFALTLTASAQVPSVINYQGRLIDNGTNFNGAGQFEFALINGGGTTNYWANDRTAIGQPVNAVPLTVTKGLYSVLLGNTALSNMTVAISPSVFNSSNVLLRVWFSDGVNGFQQLTPDQQIGSVGYAMMAQNAVLAALASNVPNGAITSAQLASNTITAANIASNTITAAQVAPGYGLVPSGSIVLSPTAANPALVAAGFAPLLSGLGANWSEATNAAPWSGRLGPGAVALNGQMWVMGGFNGASYFNDVWSSSNGVTWTEVTNSAPWVGRDYFGAVVVNGQMWVMGGSNGGGYLDDVWSSSNGVTWTETTNAAPWGAREAIGCTTINGEIWVMGGYNGAFLNDVWLSSNGLNWVEATNAAPWSQRYEMGVPAFNGEVWVLGGQAGSYFNDAWSSSNGVNWTEATNTAPWSPRSGFGSVALNGQMWILGGNNGGNSGTYYNDVWSSSNGVSWTEVTNAAPWAARYYYQAVTLNGQMWVLGGRGSGNINLNDVWFSQSTTNMLGPYFLYQKQ